MGLAKPRRRAADFAVERRRASDPVLASCLFCRGEIDSDAVKCRHCAQVLDEDFRRSALLRRRAQINYASWVAYLFGLLLFLFFKPVGVIAIGIGLLLSIAYYAIPIPPSRDERARAEDDGVSFVARQIKPERIALGIPRSRMRLVLVGTPLFAVLVGFLVNFFVLQKPMNQILRDNPEFKGMYVAAHYQYWIIPGVLVYDLRSLDEKLNPLSVHAALLEYARDRRHKSFRKVVLKFRGESRLTVNGSIFQQLGEEYDRGNFEFALFDFSTMVEPEGHLRQIPAAIRPRDALIEFHRIWYADDEISRLKDEESESEEIRPVTLHDLVGSIPSASSARTSS